MFKSLIVGKVTPVLCGANPDKIYVFGDNLIRKGKAGQACIRDCSNAFGIPTKRLPSMQEGSFFSDQEDEVEAVIHSLRVLYKISKSADIVWPRDGLGTGLAQLPQRGPKTFDKMQEIIKDYFGNPYNI